MLQARAIVAGLESVLIQDVKYAFAAQVVKNPELMERSSRTALVTNLAFEVEPRAIDQLQDAVAVPELAQVLVPICEEREAPGLRRQVGFVETFRKRDVDRLAPEGPFAGGSEVVEGGREYYALGPPPCGRGASAAGLVPGLVRIDLQVHGLPPSHETLRGTQPRIAKVFKVPKHISQRYANTMLLHNRATQVSDPRSLLRYPEAGETFHSVRHV